MIKALSGAERVYVQEVRYNAMAWIPKSVCRCYFWVVVVFFLVLVVLVLTAVFVLDF